MSNYLAGGLMLLLLISFSLLGVEAFTLYDTVRSVDAALLDAQVKMAVDGGVTPAVIQMARERLEAEGKDPERLQVEGTLPHARYGEPVRMRLVYEHPYHLALLMPSLRMSGTFRIERRAATVSGWQP